MRIALVVPGGVDRSGVQRVIPAILWLLERLSRRHDVHVVVPMQELEPGSWTLRGATVHNIGRGPPGLIGPRRIRRGPLRLRAVRKLLALHAERPFDIFHALWARGAGETALVAGRVARRPVVVSVLGGELVWLRDIRFGARWPWRRALARSVLRRADRVTAASGPMLEAIGRAGAEGIRVPLGVDTRVWSPEPPRARPHDRPARLVHVGSLTPVKDQPTLLRALAALTREGIDARLDLVGEDAWGGHVQRVARELGVDDRVVFHGFLPQDRAVPVVRGADLMVLASRHEGAPVAVREAAAVGVPTVGSAVGHVRDWAPAAAVAVPPGDPEALARAVAGLLSDEDRRLDIAREAQERSVREDADWTAARFEDLYEEAVRERRG